MGVDDFETFQSNTPTRSARSQNFGKECKNPFKSRMYTYFLGAKTFGETKFSVLWSVGRLRQPPDKNLTEFRSEAASRMADLTERGGAYKLINKIIDTIKKG